LSLRRTKALRDNIENQVAELDNVEKID
jgi:hypothetical protein